MVQHPVGPSDLGATPHPPRQFQLLTANGVGVNGCGADVGMSHPLLHHVERDAATDGVDSKAMA